MKKISRLAIRVCLIGAVTFNCINATSQGFLKASNGKIVNGNNEEVLLRGIGLGGWMLQEPYMLGLSDVTTNQTHIRSRITALIGETNTATFYNAWLASHVRKIDIDSLKAWGFNSVRLPMHYNLFTLPADKEPVAGQDTWLTTGFNLTDSLLSWCKANQMYLILDLHAAPGGQGKDAAISDYNNTSPSLWESAANQQKTISLWKKLAEKYAGEQWIGGYDLINETNWGFQNLSGDASGCSETANAPLRQLYINITNAIRQVDNNHLLFIEGNCFANNHSGLFPLWDNNVAISFHKYWNYNIQSAIQNYVNYRSLYNVPIWMGEAGENSNVWDRSAIELLESNQIGWAWWPLKKLGLNCPLEVKVNVGFQEIINYWKGTGAQPTAASAFNSLMQLTEDIKLENTFYHKDFIDAMFRQVSSTATVPFKPHLAGDIIFATDYDMGRNNSAYYDADTANFSVSTGKYTAWNNGWKYRNDGVDIEPCFDAPPGNGYNIGWTQDGEWLNYTIQVNQTGIYDLKLRTAGGSGTIVLGVNGATINPVITLPSTGGFQTWQTTTVNNILLSSGTNVIRLFTQTGGYNLSYFQFQLSTALPVLLNSFSAQTVNDFNQLSWTTATEINNSHFIIQRSANGEIFSNIGKVNSLAANGNSSAQFDYKFTDRVPRDGKNYYRLQQVDQDGKISVSAVRMLVNTNLKGLQVSISPNPVNTVATVFFRAPLSQQALLALYSSDGRLVWSNSRIINAGRQSVPLPIQQLNTGIYQLVIKAGNKTRAFNIIKQ